MSKATDAPSTPTGDGVQDAAARILSIEPDDESDTPDGTADDAASETNDTELDELASLDDEDAGGDDDEEGDQGDDEIDEDQIRELARRIKHKTRADGEDLELDYDELLRGYSRQANYTRDKQALSEERKAFQAQAEETKKARDLYTKRIEQIEELLGEQEKEPDWDELKRTLDPAEYALRYTDYQRLKERRAQVKAEKERLTKEQAAEQEKQLQQVIAAEYKALVDAIPDFGDKEKATPLMESVWKVGEEQYGFSRDELANVVDHRAIRALHDAMQYRKILARRDELRGKKKDVPTIKPGARRAPRSKNQSDAKKARARLHQSNRIEDAAKALEFLDDE